MTPETSQIEVTRVSEDELADAIVGGHLAPEKLPYHYPPCPQGQCPGCDAQAGFDAVHLMGGATA